MQGEIEAESYELQVVRDLARKLGPAIAFDADRFAAAIVKEYEIALDEAHEMVDTFDWWQRARKALGFMKQKQSIVSAEVARRRAGDAEQAVFAIKGKVKKASLLLTRIRSKNSALAEARKLIDEVESHLDKVGP